MLYTNLNFSFVCLFVRLFYERKKKEITKTTTTTTTHQTNKQTNKTQNKTKHNKKTTTTTEKTASPGKRHRCRCNIFCIHMVDSPDKAPDQYRSGSFVPDLVINSECLSIDNKSEVWSCFFPFFYFFFSFLNVHGIC